MLKVIIYISKIINNCSKHRIHHLAASFSYYFILSIPAILMLIFVLSNQFLSYSSAIENLYPAFINLFGEDIYKYIVKLLETISLNRNIGFYTSLSIFILIITSSSLFVFTKVSYSNYKNLSKKQNFFLKWLKTRIFSILLTLIVLGFYFISILISPIIKKTLNYFIAERSLNIYKFILDYIISPFLFSFFFSLYIQMVFENIPIRFAFYSGILTAYLGKIANIFLFKFIPKTLAGSIFSKAGSSLILLIYIYYIGIIIFFGFETAATLWEINKFHHGYRWLTKNHLKRLYQYNKYIIQKKIKK
ncbi:MAG: YhjD/YihY/BrkB family envelope integrity protein [Exilispira sp.]